MDQSYQVKIDAFEGPLDLLLHLIGEYKIDIYDIPVAEITKQYMNYIHTMKQLELNIASEYLVMAASLLALKSEMLLPKKEIPEDQDDYEEDPREELMNRLIEYRKYKNAAQELQDKEIADNRIYTRAPTIFEEHEIPSDMVRGDLSVYDMLGALNKMFERKEWDQPLHTTVVRTEISIEKRMNQVMSIVEKSSAGIMFDDLFVYKTRSHIVITFMALLELMKNDKIYCEQKDNFDSLYLFNSMEAS